MNTTLDTYYNRMATAQPDKMRLLDFARGKLLLDVGCGSGEFMEHSIAAGFDTFGIDPARESVLRSREVVGDHLVREAYADELEKVDDKYAYNTVVMSSVLHEVFSYGNRDGKIGKLTSMGRAIDSAYNVLLPGGRLIIRDGIRPSGYHGRMTVDDNAAVEKFIRESPFAWQRYGPNYEVDRNINLNSRAAWSKAEEHSWSGSPSALMEFAFTYVWGDNSWDREVKEFYGIHDKNNYKQFVQRRGFRMVHFESYIQQGYVDHLRNRVTFEFDFPKTNAIWVYEKI